MKKWLKVANHGSVNARNLKAAPTEPPRIKIRRHTPARFVSYSLELMLLCRCRYVGMPNAGQINVYSVVF